MLHHSYQSALLAGAAIVVVAAVLLRHRLSNHLGPYPGGYWPPDDRRR